MLYEMKLQYNLNSTVDTLNAWGFNPDVEYVANWLGE